MWARICTALLETKGGLSFWLALPATVVLVGLLSILLGLVVVRFAGFGFVILTLVIASIVPVFFGTFQYFGRYVGILNIPRPAPSRFRAAARSTFISNGALYYLASWARA